LTCCAIPAWRKGHCHQGQGKDKAVPRTERTGVQEETSGETRRHHWNKGLRLKEATTSEEGEDIQQDHRENHWAGDCEANSWVLCQDLKNECRNIVEEPVTAKMK
jgi:hypothetical protein